MTEEPNDQNQPPEAEEPQGTEPEATEPEGTEPAQPEAEQPSEPQAEPPAAEPAPAEPAVEETPVEPQAAEPTPEPPAAEEPAPEQPAAEEPAAAAEPPPAEQPAPPARPAPTEKAKDVPPGAELEPIALEPERELSAEERARLEAEEEERARLEAETDEGDEPLARSGPTVELAKDALIQATGKRKSSIARVVVRPGGGSFVVNSKSLDEYFPRQYLRTLIRQPLVTAGYESTVDVQVRVHGGGVAGQAGAVRHGIARALTEIDPELRGELKRRGLLTRDARRKERRKAGLKKARKRPQFSKR
jgi:small subunit ribosomal protein S9